MIDPETVLAMPMCDRMPFLLEQDRADLEPLLLAFRPNALPELLDKYYMACLIASAAAKLKSERQVNPKLTRPTE